MSASRFQQFFQREFAVCKIFFFGISDAVFGHVTQRIEIARQKVYAPRFIHCPAVRAVAAGDKIVFFHAYLFFGRLAV